MTKEELIEKLKFIKDNFEGDAEVGHVIADDALLEYINDKDISIAYSDICKYYA